VDEARAFEIVSVALSEVLGIPIDQVRASSSIGDPVEWDSLASLEIAERLEEATGLRLSTAEILRIRSVNDIIALLDDRLRGSIR
jgi:acyl carrier protein